VVMERSVQASDGRTLAVEDSGDPAGRPVLVHVGTPSSRHLYGPHVADATQRGLRLISYDRPGYGGSTPHPGRIAADCVADVKAICEALGIDRLGMWGISGGGPHVLACAALLPDLVAAAVSLASPAPYDAEGLDWFVGYGELNAEDARLLLTDRKAARAKLDKEREEMLAASASELAETMKSILTPTDAAALTGELAEYLTQAAHEGLAPGNRGYWEDNCAWVSPWGFDVADIAVPVLLLHGREDKFHPLAHGQWLAAHIPGAKARFLENDGHLTLLERHIGEVHSWLSDHL
jgi:pimeloyl-ACP methyl ester carboxylesterase